MKKLDANNPFFRLMSLLGDLALLSAAWLVCCLPVVTAGAATLALLSVACKMAAGDKACRVLHDFFRALRRDFWQATALWLPMLLAAGLLVFDFLYARDTARVPGGILTALSVAGMLLWLAAFGWGFALLARYTYARGRDALRNGMALAIRHPLATLAVCALGLWPAVLFFAFPEAFFYLLPFALLFGPGASALGLAYAVRPAFAQIESAQGAPPPEAAQDTPPPGEDA